MTELREKLKKQKEMTLNEFKNAKKEPSLEISDKAKMKFKELQKDTIKKFKAMGMDPRI